MFSVSQSQFENDQNYHNFQNCENNKKHNNKFPSDSSLPTSYNFSFLCFLSVSVSRFYQFAQILRISFSLLLGFWSPQRRCSNIGQKKKRTKERPKRRRAVPPLYFPALLHITLSDFNFKPMCRKRTNMTKLIIKWSPPIGGREESTTTQEEEAATPNKREGGKTAPPKEEREHSSTRKERRTAATPRRRRGESSTSQRCVLSLAGFSLAFDGAAFLCLLWVTRPFLVKKNLFWIAEVQFTLDVVVPAPPFGWGCFSPLPFSVVLLPPPRPFWGGAAWFPPPCGVVLPSLSPPLVWMGRVGGAAFPFLPIPFPFL